MRGSMYFHNFYTFSDNIGDANDADPVNLFYFIHL